MSQSAVSIYCMHMCNVIAAAVTVHKQHSNAYSPWSHHFFGCSKTVCKSSYHEQESGMKRQMLIFCLQIHSQKLQSSTRTANFKHTSSKIWPLIYRKMDIGDFNNRNAPVYVNTQLNHMRRILSYIQLYICHSTDKATYRRVTNIYKKFASLTLHDNIFYCSCW